ncbi:class I SAM-dependent methyltransferase [Zeimonas arvi]|uniref:Class I SAM-dependent methyltransferase n=1 Tax=Zeimonas arvi TaxID=2498847 RepID=A0A5C8NY18_9BURK|nr:class I SAM-dependent methyltransferase [Zeimonas arvi]TXL65955.1 class I SAM-dependent methyltransferase [Zeimonas arvi]
MSLNGLLAINAALLVVTLLVLAACFHKIRRTHLATYEISENGRATRREAEALFDQIHALLSLGCRLQLPKALPPMRGWAASPDFLLLLANEILDREVRTVLECSSGSSTVIAARCLQLRGRGHVYSLEHDPQYADKTRALLKEHRLQEWATVIDAPLVTREGETPWYSLSNLPATLDNVDLLVIDGPPGGLGPLARYPALPRLHERLAASSTIILDDASREGEQRILERWKTEFPEFRQEFLHLEKGAAVLRRCEPTQTGVN